MWEEYWKFHTENDLDNLLARDWGLNQSKLKSIREKYIGGLYNFDKIGRPVFIEKLGQSNLKALFKVISKILLSQI